MRGFGATGRAKQVNDLIRHYRVEIVCLQGTIKVEFSPRDLRRLVGDCPFSWHFVSARGHSGGTVIGVNNECFQVCEVDQGSFFCSVKIKKNHHGSCLGPSECLWASTT
jgi:hypothetical protein